VSYLELKNRLPVPELATKSLYFNFSRSIHQTSEENLLAIPRKSRAMVRKGIKAGLKAEWGEHLFDEFYRILAKSYHRLGTPIFPKRLFRAFLAEFGDQVDLMVVRKSDGEGVASVMTFFYQDRVMPYYAGSLVEHRELAPNDFMYWELMEYGRGQGFKIFDFGRSKAETGSFSFKKNWGFEAQPLAYQYHVVKGKTLPNLSPTNPKYRRKIELWRKMPFELTRLLGPPLAKYLA
jgi:FemAB-related protein (PEP-CTERM system-associated)